MYVPHFLYPFICQWTFLLPPYFGCCESYCNKYRGRSADISLGSLVPLDIYLQVGLLDHIVILFGNYNKAKCICTAKEISNERKRQCMIWQKIFDNCISAGHLMFKIYRGLNNKQQDKNKNCINNQI